MPLRTFYYTRYSYWHVLWMKIGFNLTEMNIIGHSGGMAGFLHDLIFHQAEGNAGYWWISDPDFDEAVRLKSGAPNSQRFDSDVINDGDGVDQGIADTVAKMGEADSEQRNGLNHEIAGSKVAGAINDGGEVDPGVVETAIKKWDDRSASILRNGQNNYSGKAQIGFGRSELVRVEELRDGYLGKGINPLCIIVVYIVAAKQPEGGMEDIAVDEENKSRTGYRSQRRALNDRVRRCPWVQEYLKEKCERGEGEGKWSQRASAAPTGAE
ncbi:hypothetical protein DFH09DRAFT_1108434 [Mycena vulgaris]|nr:hypothetical protein DFH09DRAFT_1108434 [Mycena vulgaris]